MSEARSNPSTTKITVAHGAPIVRYGLLKILSVLTQSDVPETISFHEIRSAKEMANEILLRPPDLLIMQRDFVGLNGTQALATIRRNALSCQVILVNQHWPDDAVKQVVDDGARGLISIDDSENTILSVVMNALRRDGPVIRVASDPEPVAMADADRREARISAEAISLQAREVQILQCIAEGRTIKQSAERLLVSPSTVKNLRHSLYTKLNVPNAGAAVEVGKRLGLIP